MDSQKRKLLSNKYECFTCLLLYYSIDTYLPHKDWDDLKTVKRFILEESTEVVIDAMKEGREVIGLEDFPDEWIRGTTNRFPFKMSNEATEQDYYDWVKWMVDTLEVEAKKASKL